MRTFLALKVVECIAAAIAIGVYLWLAPGPSGAFTLVFVPVIVVVMFATIGLYLVVQVLLWLITTKLSSTPRALILTLLGAFHLWALFVSYYGGVDMTVFHSKDELLFPQHIVAIYGVLMLATNIIATRAAVVMQRQQ